MKNVCLCLAAGTLRDRLKDGRAFFKFINLNLISPNQTACTQADLFYCMPHNNHYHKTRDVDRVAAKKKKEKNIWEKWNIC